MNFYTGLLVGGVVGFWVGFVIMAALSMRSRDDYDKET